MHQGKIVVGLSGGVDSSVTALLLQEQGYQVEGLFIKSWSERRPDGGCMWEADAEDARQVCEILGIPLNTIDFSADYRDKVFTDFIQAYKNGYTPNPDVLCNQAIKFGAFLQHVIQLGAKKIATGHYARISRANNQYRLHKGLDNNKDQSYFLCCLKQSQLQYARFPIGDLKKHQVRALAKQAGFPNHDKKDSTGLCFIGEQPFREFLGRYLPTQEGDIQTLEGKTIGRHQGAFYYTLGQRQGLGIGGIQSADETPWYVAKKDMDNNILYVVQGHDHPALFSRQLQAEDISWIAGKAPRTPYRCTAKTRYRQADQNCIIDRIENDFCQISFDQPQRAVTPGQFIVFYDGEHCLGGGSITHTN